MKKKPIEVMSLHGCYVKDERGVILAQLFEAEDKIIVDRTTACSVGTYLYIISYLKRLGFDAE